MVVSKAGLASCTGVNGSDMTEPADKKSRAIVSTEPDVHGEPHSGVLSLLASRFSSLFPVAATQYVEVLTDDMAGYFGSLWDTLLCAVYPGYNHDDTAVINQGDFVLICRYLTKSRIDQVYSACSARRPPHRIAIPRGFEVPKSLADIINGIGTVTEPLPWSRCLSPNQTIQL